MRRFDMRILLQVELTVIQHLVPLCFHIRNVGADKQYDSNAKANGHKNIKLSSNIQHVSAYEIPVYLLHFSLPLFL